VPITHTERVDIYSVTDEPPVTAGGWERDLAPQQVKVTLRSDAENTWSPIGVSVLGPYVDADGMPGTQRCHYYSGDRIAQLPGFANDALVESVRLANQP
jgi:hypothetical protein